MPRAQYLGMNFSHILYSERKSCRLLYTLFAERKKLQTFECSVCLNKKYSDFSMHCLQKNYSFVTTVSTVCQINLSQASVCPISIKVPNLCTVCAVCRNAPKFPHFECKHHMPITLHGTTAKCVKKLVFVSPVDWRTFETVVGIYCRNAKKKGMLGLRNLELRTI